MKHFNSCRQAKFVDINDKNLRGLQFSRTKIADEFISNDFEYLRQKK